jgi:hypothetical protein
MLCLACGRDHEALAAQLGSRAFECLAGKNGPRANAGYEQINGPQGSPAFAPPSDASSSAVDCRAVEPNAWVQSLKRAQQRCAALAEAAARDRAASRAAQRKGAAAGRKGAAVDRRDLMPPAPTPPASQSPAPPPSRPEEPNKLDTLWDNLAGGVPASPSATSTFEQSIEQESHAPSELSPVPATRDQTPVAPQEPILQPLVSPNEQINEGASVASSELAPPSVTDRENIDRPREQGPQTSACASSANHSIDVSSVLPAVPVPDLSTSCQTTEHLQDEQASNPVELSPDGATSSRPVDVPRSPMLRAMVALLRTGLRRLDGDGAHHR